MDRTLLTFSAAVALSITLRAIPITAQQGGARPNAKSPSPEDLLEGSVLSSAHRAAVVDCQ